MGNTYWNHNGKHQALADKLEQLMPSYGYTYNRNMNLFILMSHLYYDAHNNSGGNVMDCYTADYDRYMPDDLKKKVKLEYFSTPLLDKAELAMDLALEHLKDADIHYVSYTLWRNNCVKQYCLSAQTGDGWFRVSFGSLMEKNKYIKDMESSLGYSRLILPAKSPFKEPPVICPRCGEHLYHFSGDRQSQVSCPHCGYFHADIYEKGKIVELYHNDGFGAANFTGSKGFEQTAIPCPYSRHRALAFFSKCKEEYDGEITEATLTWWDAQNNELLVLVKEKGVR